MAHLADDRGRSLGAWLRTLWDGIGNHDAYGRPVPEMDAPRGRDLDMRATGWRDGAARGGERSGEGRA